MKKILNVEILRAGTWNGTKITAENLQQMIENFDAGIIEPYLNLDHDDKFTDKVKASLKVVALGWVSALRREGDRLFADFKQVPEKIAGLIENGAIKKRSVEFFRKGYKQNGSAYDNVLKAVSFFGADIPAVNNLSDEFLVLQAVQEAEGESLKILIQENNMDEITLKKSEYENLVSVKATAEKLEGEIVSLKSETEALKKSVSEKEAEILSLNKFKEDHEKQKALDLKAEAENFIVEAVKAGKIKPAHKDQFVADYMAKSADPEKLLIFKEDIADRGKVVNLPNMKDVKDEGNTEEFSVDYSKMTNDEIFETIELKAKKDSITFEAAAVALGIHGYTEGK